MKNFEFDKIAISIALGIFTVMASNNLGNLFYSKNISTVRGYEIEIKEGNPQGSSGASHDLPAEIDIIAIMAKANAEQGSQIFKKCAICHTANKGEANKVGPNLWNIVDAITAQHKDYAYSSAMMARGAAGKQWTLEELYRYLYSPKKHVPGTKMAFAGIKNDEERANLIAYLVTLSDSPKSLAK